MHLGNIINFPANEHRVAPVYPPRGQRPGVARSNTLDDFAKSPRHNSVADSDNQRCSGVCLQPRECNRLGGVANRECMNGAGRVCCNCTCCFTYNWL